MIKNELKKMLAEKQLSINKLAYLTGIRYATIFDFIKNKTQKADYEMMNKICKALGCQPGDFLKYYPDQE